MYSVFATQRNASNNQSTVDYERRNVFIREPRYQEDVIVNDTGAEITVDTGILVMRSTTGGFEVKPALTAADMANVIGVLRVPTDEIVLDAGATANVNVCVRGELDSTLLDLPAGITLQTKVGDKCLKDVLTGLGFLLFNVTELSKFEN